jgi:hypothetical protein
MGIASALAILLHRKKNMTMGGNYRELRGDKKGRSKNREKQWKPPKEINGPNSIGLYFVEWEFTNGEK